MAEAALAELQDSILSGELAPGTPLRLEELADRLGMSISPVREAVRRLESLGLAVHVPHRGARVSELALDDLRDAYEVRLLLEPVQSVAPRSASRQTMPQRPGRTSLPTRRRVTAPSTPPSTSRSTARRTPSGSSG